MKGFALYRLPYTKEVKYISGEVTEVMSCVELSNAQGFVMVPFAPSAEQPLLVIRPEHQEKEKEAELSLSSIAKSDLPRSNYHIDFLNFHAHLLNGNFQKLVLSRSLVMERQKENMKPELDSTKEADTPLDLFHKACEHYPRMFIALVYTPKSGLWLAATPEILLAGSGREWQTVALAGTMPYSEQVTWSDKDIQEQRYVATYITEQLEQFTSHFQEDGPHTIRAGHLAHLRSDFRFTLDNPKRIGELLHALHPTPAVCGLPKEEAFQFILHNEHHQRSFYSGFMGPLFVDGDTHLFVTLRCMQIFQNAYRLYAGGGLLKESTEEREWQETETKLDTMRNLLRGKRQE